MGFEAWHKPNLNIINSHYGVVFVNGNGHTIKLNGATKRNEYHFATINKAALLSVSDLQIIGFNCAVINNGTAAFNNVTFSGNNVEYILESGDDAGAISNFGLLACNNCTIVNNYGLGAGAIYTAHGAPAYLNNCTIKDNPYSKSDGADLYSFNKGTFTVDGIPVNGTYVNGTDITVGYGELPSGAKKVLYQGLDVFTNVGSMVIGFVAGVLGSPGAGVAVGTTLGIASNLMFRLYYASLTHNFSYHIFAHLPVDVFSHFVSAFSGAKIWSSLKNSHHGPNNNDNQNGENGNEGGHRRVNDNVLDENDFPRTTYEKFKNRLGIKKFEFKGDGAPNTKVRVQEYFVKSADGEKGLILVADNDYLEFKDFCNIHNIKHNVFMSGFEMPGDVNEVYNELEQYKFKMDNNNLESVRLKDYKLRMVDGNIKYYTVSENMLDGFVSIIRKYKLNFRCGAFYTINYDSGFAIYDI